VRVRGRAARVLEFLLGEGGFQLFVDVMPRALPFLKRLRRVAPAGILNEDLLFVGRGEAAFGFDLLEEFDCFDVGARLGLGTARANLVFGSDLVV